MYITFILHRAENSKEICVSCDYSAEGTKNEPGTDIWWKDENGDQHHATVKETLDDITKAKSAAIRRAKV